MKTLHFTVDAALFRELGERLVGRPGIALAELIKNAYDADATAVDVRLGQGTIEVTDDGHGMNFEAFRDYWMRVGSPHKERAKLSPRLRRPLTGSKGIGRLAVQFLADRVTVRTVARARGSIELTASVDWRKAVKSGDLTQATASYKTEPRAGRFPSNSWHGTSILLEGLRQDWTEERLRELAREIWFLQPPFLPARGSKHSFGVNLAAEDDGDAAAFRDQMTAYLDLWQAKIRGEIIRPPARLGDRALARVSVDFRDGAQEHLEYEIPDCYLSMTSFEIRVFKLDRRLRHGLKVDEVRTYVRQYGGVHVYDAGFHLPYYGPDADWLKLEQDHAHRLTRSELLPESLQNVPRGMNFLPTQSRVLGIVHVNTATERAESRASKSIRASSLMIQVSRDRLVDNEAFRSLQYVVRFAIDYYATREARRAFERTAEAQASAPARAKIVALRDTLAAYSDQIPQPVLRDLDKALDAAARATVTEAEAMAAQLALLAPLATAGITALSYEHEVGKQLAVLERAAESVDRIASGGRLDEAALSGLGVTLRDWVRRARETRALFTHLLDDENRERRDDLRARATVNAIAGDIRLFTRGLPITTTNIDGGLLVPSGSYAEWSAVFQNLLLNAANAVLDSDVREIDISSETDGDTQRLYVQDTGSGIDLETSEQLFKPFERRSAVSRDRRGLGLGGTGLGLTIVRMIANRLGCKVRFVPVRDSRFHTAVEISWRDEA
jgi:signal transduction histidine kinase